MGIYSSLSAWVDDVSDLNRKATYRALNKATSKTNTQFKRVVQKDTGLKSKEIAPRLMQRKASMKSLTAYVSFGTRFGIPLSLFKPKVKLVRKSRKRGSRKYQGVTVSVPANGGRYVVPGAFLMNTRSGKSLVVARAGTARLPVNELKFPLNGIALSHQQELKQYMGKEFKSQFSEQLKYLVKK